MKTDRILIKVGVIHTPISDPETHNQRNACSRHGSSASLTFSEGLLIGKTKGNKYLTDKYDKKAHGTKICLKRVLTEVEIGLQMEIM